MQVQSLGWEDPLEEAMATHSSTLNWKIPWTEEPERLQSREPQRIGREWGDLACTKASFQFNSVTQLCPTLCDPMDCSRSGFPVHHQFPELAQTHVYRVGDGIYSSNSTRHQTVGKYLIFLMGRLRQGACYPVFGLSCLNDPKVPWYQISVLQCMVAWRLSRVSFCF